MKKYLLTVAAVLTAASAAPSWSAVDVGVGITIREPGVYGRIEIGTQAPPPLVYAQPVIIQQPTVVVHQPPMYLYVPPGHAKDWSKHCSRYNACSRQVYFVKEEWVQTRYDEHHGKGKNKGDKGNGNGNGKGNKHN